MHEDEFRSGLRGVMSLTTPPEPMNTDAMVEKAQRHLRRRRARLAGAGAGAAVAAIAVGAVVIGVQPPDGGTVGVGAATPLPTGIPTSGGLDSGDTKPQFPPGQTDWTASSGPRWQKGEQLITALGALAPEGYGKPTDLTYPDGGKLHRSEAQAAGTMNNYTWTYDAYLPLTKGDGVGRLVAEVTNKPGLPQDPCELATGLWGMGGACEVVTVDGKQVGVAVAAEGSRDDFDQWAAYRQADGTAVYVAQGKKYVNADKPALADLPLTKEQLAKLAVNESLHVR